MLIAVTSEGGVIGLNINLQIETSNWHAQGTYKSWLVDKYAKSIIITWGTRPQMSIICRINLVHTQIRIRWLQSLPLCICRILSRMVLQQSWITVLPPEWNGNYMIHLLTHFEILIKTKSFQECNDSHGIWNTEEITLETAYLIRSFIDENYNFLMGLMHYHNHIGA